MKYWIPNLAVSTALVAFFALPAGAQDEVTLTPVKDNTLFEVSSGSLSSGSGRELYSGRTGPNAGGRRHRAILAFDVASEVPGGATIQSAELTIRVSKESPQSSGAHDYRLHRVLADWGEGSSSAASGSGAQAQAGDATWLHTFFDSALWSNLGGDFSSTPSATISINNPGQYTWPSTAQLVEDVQLWLDDPGSSFGWIIIGDETIMHSARAIDSREASTATNRPSLRVTFMTGVAVEDETELPEAVALRSTYPNPFTESTTIEFEVSESRVVTIEVYDTLGRRISTLADGWHGPGTYQATFSADNRPAGVYFFRLVAGEVSTYRQAVLLR